MNYHILWDFHKKNQILTLALVAMLTLPGVLDSFAQEDQVIKLATNKAYYIPGDVVQLSGTITGQQNVLVALQVKDSTGNLILIRTVQSNQNGFFTLSFKIPPTAASGNFSIIASARINGFVVTQTKTMAATVPEFGSLVMPMFAISFLVIITLFTVSSRFKTNSGKITQHYSSHNPLFTQ